MKQSQTHRHWGRALAIVLLLWGLSAIADRLWFLADQSVPAWDQADYLSASLTYLRGLQQPQWGSGDWWTQFWKLRSKIPPLTYISAAIVQMVAGTGPDEAAIVLSLFSGVLLTSVFVLGTVLFSSQIGVWAAALCLLLPGFYRFRLDFLLDYPLTAMVTASFAALTLWRASDRSLATDSNPLTTQVKGRAAWPFRWLTQWLAAIAFSISLGLAFLTKQPALFFLALPCLWLLVGSLVRRAWGRLLQLLAAFTISLMIWGPWYRANWFLMLTAGKRATVDSAAIEGDPPLNTLAAWTFYAEQLPRFITWPLMVVSLAGLIAYGVWRLLHRPSRPQKNGSDRTEATHWRANSWGWLLVYLAGGYLLSSLNVNKDARYILPLLPVVAIVLAAGLVAWGRRGWGQRLRWGTIVTALLLASFNLMPLGIQTGVGLGWSHSPHLQEEWPHPQMVDSILSAEPYLEATVGVLPSTAEINQHNVSYYGALKNRQVFGRQVGTKQADLQRDGRSLSWFLTKTGDPGSVPSTQSEMQQIVEEGGDFALHKSWNLPRDRGTLKLYRQIYPSVSVDEITPRTVMSETVTGEGDRVRLTAVEVPETAPPGQPVPVTYTWAGSGDELAHGVVVLTWEPVAELEEGDTAETPQEDLSQDSQASQRKQQSQLELQALQEEGWIHDRGIGAGRLRTGDRPDTQFLVVDRTAMLPPANTFSGSYILRATYLNRTTGSHYDLEVPETARIVISSSALTIPAPELDLVSQLRNLAPQLRRGDFDRVFGEIGRINQYDPTQDYLDQATASLNYRLAETPDDLNLLYALALANVQQQDVEAALHTLETAAHLDPENPFAQGFVAFVHLYAWHPNLAQPWIDAALSLDADLEEIQILDGVAALMRGNLAKAWRVANQFL